MMAACLMITAFAACTSEDYESVPDGFPVGDSTTVVTMHLQGTVTPFTGDDGTTRAATDWDWQDGAVLYLQFYNGSNRIRSYAVYTKSTESWEIPTWAGTIGTKDKCEVYFFRGANTSSKTNVTLGPGICVYADRNASYAFENGVVTVSASLTPQTGRIRFLRATGTKVNNVKVEGITVFSAYDATTNTLSTSGNAIYADVTSSGYTNYINGKFTDSSNRQLTIGNDEDGYDKVMFSRTFGSNVLQTGHSGYMTIPTISTNKGWTVMNHSTTGTEVGHNWVDLGLSVCWATTNIGASNEGDYGNYYAWGETAIKNDYRWSTYKYCRGSETTLTKYCTSSDYGTVDNKTQLDLIDDVARQVWGGKWRMPTYIELNELNTQCTWTWTTQNGHKGYLVTGPNGKSIFLPAAGFRSGTSLLSDGSYGSYWSSSLSTAYPYNALFLLCGSGHNMNSDRRYYGNSVRPVITFDDNTPDPITDESRTFTFTGNGKTVTFTMKRVEAGTFQMGGSDSDASNDEKPVHSVTLTQDYYLGETEVTQALWYAVMGQKPTSGGLQWSSSYGVGDNYPAYYISYEDCQTFLSSLNSKLSSQLLGMKFNFPTEAQWEYAARGGNKSKGYLYAGSNTIGDVAWYIDNSSSKTHEVKGKQANELGLYDMSGNVWEWCYDWYGSYSSGGQTNPTGPSSGSNRVYRGGSWNVSAGHCRSSYRYNYSPSGRGPRLGFRLALQ